MSANAPLGKPLDFQYVSDRSVRALVVAGLIRTFVKPVLLVFGRWPQLPWPYAVVDLAARVLPALRGTRREQVRLEHCRAEMVTGSGVSAGGRAILYAHGGGFVACGLNTHRRLISRLSKQTGLPVLSVDYRMLPKNAISAAVEDCLAGFRHLLDSGYAAEAIVVAGDSAGGYLAARTSLTAVQRGLGRPAGLLCWSPFIDVDTYREDSREWRSRDALLPASVINVLTEFGRRADERIAVGGAEPAPESLLSADLSALPPTLIQAGSHELFSADAKAFANRLSECSVPTVLELWERQFHVFPAAADLLPEGKAAIVRAGKFIDSLTPQRVRPDGSAGASIA